MSIAIKRFIGKTQSRRCLRGEVAVGSQAIVSLNLLRNVLINGRLPRQLMLGSDSLYVRAKKAYWLPITCMPLFGFGMVKKNRRAAGISWYAGKSARTV